MCRGTPDKWKEGVRGRRRKGEALHKGKGLINRCIYEGVGDYGGRKCVEMVSGYKVM